MLPSWCRAPIKLGMVTTYAFFPSSPRCVPRCSYVLHTRMIPFSSAGPCEPQTASVCSLPSSESVCCKIWLLTPYSVLSLFSSNQPTGFCPSAVLAGKSDKRSAFFGISFRSVGKLKPSHTHTCLNLCRAHTHTCLNLCRARTHTHTHTHTHLLESVSGTFW